MAGGKRLNAGVKKAGVKYSPKEIDINEQHIQMAKDLLPSGLDYQTKKIFLELAPQLIACGRLKPIFLGAFEDYCHMTTEIKTLRARLKKEGFTITNVSGNIVKHPLLTYFSEKMKNQRAAGIMFGLSPASEKGLSTENTETKDEFDKI